MLSKNLNTSNRDRFFREPSVDLHWELERMYSGVSKSKSCRLVFWYMLWRVIKISWKNEHKMETLVWHVFPADDAALPMSSIAHNSYCSSSNESGSPWPTTGAFDPTNQAERIKGIARFSLTSYRRLQSLANSFGTLFAVSVVFSWLYSGS